MTSEQGGGERGAAFKRQALREPPAQAVEESRTIDANTPMTFIAMPEVFYNRIAALEATVRDLVVCFADRSSKRTTTLTRREEDIRLIDLARKIEKGMQMANGEEMQKQWPVLYQATYDENMKLREQLADRRRAEIWQAVVALVQRVKDPGAHSKIAVEQAIFLHAEFEKQMGEE